MTPPSWPPSRPAPPSRTWRPSTSWRRRWRWPPDRWCPFADPDGGGVRAQVLLLLETPSRAGGYRTGLISVDNDDTAAANLWRALAANGLDRRRVLLWNAVPWYVGSPDKIRSPNPAEVRAGRVWLSRLLEHLPDLVVLACLRRAAAAAVAPLRPELEARGLVVLEAPHPSQRSYNRPGAQAQSRVHGMLRAAGQACARGRFSRPVPADAPVDQAGQPV